MNYKKVCQILSNLVYPIVGWFGGWITLLAGLSLLFGSGWMHYNKTETSTLFDWYGMYAMSLSVLAYLTNWWVLLLLTPIVLLKNKIKNIYLIGTITLIAMLIDQNLYAIGTFGLAYGIRQWGKQWWTHSLWHLLTGVGYYFLLY